VDVSNDNWHTIAAASYQRFVKTTPKPKATKKSSGELEFPPPPPPPPPAPVGVGDAVGDDAEVDDMMK